MSPASLRDKQPHHFAVRSSNVMMWMLAKISLPCRWNQRVQRTSSAVLNDCSVSLRIRKELRVPQAFFFVTRQIESYTAQQNVIARRRVGPILWIDDCILLHLLFICFCSRACIFCSLVYFYSFLFIRGVFCFACHLQLPKRCFLF
jgi:hypothetical protein